MSVYAVLLITLPVCVCDSNGCLDLNYKGEIEYAPTALTHGLNLKDEKCKWKILSLDIGLPYVESPIPSMFAIDTGCACEQLTAMCLETGERVSVS